MEDLKVMQQQLEDIMAQRMELQKVIDECWTILAEMKGGDGDGTIR